MSRYTPTYALPAFASTDRVRDLADIDYQNALKLEAILQNQGQPPLDSDLATLMARTNLLPWTYPPLQNGWTNDSAQRVRYTKFGPVAFLQGRASGGNGTTMFTLPAGYRPGQLIRLVALNGTGSAAALMSFPIDTDGVVAVGTGNDANFNCMWLAEQ
ncbi:hypothetical protein [Curtobacterium sp. VKM Ac-1376]|uniref:hypothetical protein n=1 Tax=Curtobacterium sp. VKM Ac-1376 TaxID=123312 RepID=UPI00188C2267|nr:hypothetical protein [Curtobacterium sp. VKM Ac-1376]MBF4613277.1 hypothetical protein [Curtobacterium sp. VKM Ac-1376]